MKRALVIIGLLSLPFMPGREASASTGISSQNCAEVSVGPAEVVVTNAARERHQLGGWPETALGVLPDSGGFHRFVSVNPFGGTMTRPQANVVTRGTLADPLAGGVLSSTTVEKLPGGYEWAGGGPVFRDPDSGLVLQVLHLERYAHDRFYGELHLGRFDVATGRTTYLGPMVRPRVDMEAALSRGYNIDLGTSSLTLIDGYLHVYFSDASFDVAGNLAVTGLSTARAPLGEVIAAARSGTVSPWRKYHQGEWASPGIGGDAGDLQPGMPSAWAPNVIRAAEGGVIMVAAADDREIVMSSSPDGLTGWTPRIPLFRDPEYTNAYVTAVGTDDPSVAGRQFYVYNTQFLDKQPNLRNMQLVRHLITCTAGSATTTVPLIRHRFPDGRHRVTTTEVKSPGAYPEYGGIWGLYRTKHAGTAPLYGCREGTSGYFITRDVRCGGKDNALLNTEGWIHTTAPDVPSALLYRCRQAGGDSYVSIDPTCEGAGTASETLGHALWSPRVLFSRFASRDDHWETSGAVTTAYAREGSWYLEPARTAGTVPLYGCLTGTDHFVTRDAGCAGRTEGYIHTARPSEAYQAIYRCSWGPSRERFTSIRDDCEGAPGAVREALLGYVLPADAPFTMAAAS
ncbi:hypothetical protein AB0C27_22010 [Nonomuraea sp. NPDC048882]|uniref:hypothetical protein n=1 Tax=Nonomuraea sp. NPDC048882 TaxID=3154347 RepID=UPI0033DCDCE5